MATVQDTRSRWVHALLARAADSRAQLDRTEQVRRRAETERLLAQRDLLPSIAPDRAWTYIRETRDEPNR